MAQSKRLVLVGAGHAHLTTLQKLDDFASENFVISLRSYQYYSGMGPGMLAGYYSPGQVRFNVKRMAERRGAKFIEAAVTHVDTEQRLLTLSNGEQLPYDIVSFNIGSEINVESVKLFDNVIPVKPVERLFAARCAIQSYLKSKQLRAVVIGGGAAGIEVAANLLPISSGMPNGIEVTVVTRKEVLASFPQRVRSYTRAKLTRLGIKIVEGVTVKENDDKEIILQNGESIPFDYAFIATGTRPPRLFLDSGLPTGATGGLLVGPNLNCQTAPEVFGGGDCIDFEPRALTKVGVYAVRQNPILLNNLRAALSGQPLRVFSPQKLYHLIINYGDGTGLSFRRPLMLKGKTAFNLKDRIDGKFMRRFQESGESGESVDCGQYQ